MTTDHMADMQLGQFVIGQVQHREALRTQALDQRLARVILRMGLHADEDVRFAVSVIAIVELGDLALAHRLAEGLEATRLFGDGHGDDRFALLAQLGALSNVAQAVEVDVGAGIDTHQHFAVGALTLDVLLDPGHGQRAGRLGDRTGIVVDVLDCRTDFVGADGDHFIDVILADIEGVLADLRHCHAVGEQPDHR